MDVLNEITWKPIPDFNNYEASSLGTVRNIKTHKILSTNPGKQDGYIKLTLKNNKGDKKTVKIHRLVCFAFHGNPLCINMTVDHIDRNPSNNKPSNLRWASQSLQNHNKKKLKEKAGFPVWQLDPGTKHRIY
jgi:hypothetical protein